MAKKAVVKKTVTKAKAKPAKVAKKTSKRVPEQQVMRRRPAPAPVPAEDAMPGSSTLVPGYLVSLKTSVNGNVSYVKEVIEPEHQTRGGITRAKWQTEKITQDQEEHNKANQVRMKARALIQGTCVVSSFGLLCPEANVPEFNLALVEARKIVAEFNRRARITNVGVYVITGKVARDDVEAVRAIKSEVRELLKMMSDGVGELDVKKVRDAANKARNLGAMLTPDAAAKIQGAIEAARGAARKLVKAGEEAAGAIDQEAIEAITSARTSFLDLDAGPVEIEAAEVEGREVELQEA